MQSPGGLPPYYELSWSILSTIGIFLTILSIWAVLISRPSPLSYIPIIVSTACAIANGLCFFAFYTTYPIPNRAFASALADLLWLVQEAGLTFYSYQILIHTLRDLSRLIFLLIFWSLMVVIVALRVAILIARVLGIIGGGPSAVVAMSPYQTQINYLHIGYFTAIALVEICSAGFLINLLVRAFRASPRLSSTRPVFQYLLTTTEMRLASLCFVGVSRAITYSFQTTSQAVTSIAGEVDRFVYTFECLFPIIMVIDILASKKIDPNVWSSLNSAILISPRERELQARWAV